MSRQSEGRWATNRGALAGGLRAGALLLSLCAGACLPDATRPPTPAAPEPPPPPPPDLASPEEVPDGGVELTAQQLFRMEVQPSLEGTCGPCHKGAIGPAFLASARTDRYDPYPTVIGWDNFLVESPEQSLLLTRGQHEGPAMNTDQAERVLRWLRKEKEERDRLTQPSKRPQVRPFVPRLAPAQNRLELRELSPLLDGAHVTFTASLGSGGRGLTLRDVRFVNALPGALPEDQRTVRVVHPLFVVWSGGAPQPDLADSLATLDRSYKLDETDGGGPGVQLATLLALPSYRSGDSVSLAFYALELVGQVVSPSTCRPAGLSHFATVVRPYLAQANACTRSGCHNAVSQAASLSMAAVLMAPAGDNSYLAKLCEQLKFYRNNGTILANTDPANPLGNEHPFRWTAMECATAGYAGACFTGFAATITEWSNIDK